MSQTFFRRSAFSRYLIALAISFFSLPVEAQTERYELGKRLRRFEESWAKAAPEQQLKSTPALQKAVSSFFGLQLNKAAAKLDDAWLTVETQLAEDWKRELVPYRVKVNRAVFEIQAQLPADDEAQNQESLQFSVEALYQNANNEKQKLESRIPPQTPVAIALVDTSGTIVQKTETTWEEVSAGLKISLRENPPGDYRLRAVLTHQESAFEFLPVGVSLIEGVESRLEKLEQARNEKQSSLSDTLRASLGEYIVLIRQGRENFSAETDYPYQRLLALAEFIVDHPDESTTAITELAQSQDLWLVLAEKRKRVPVRIRAPELIHDRVVGKLPVLFLFHGAGGSENMFFETYGAGDAVRLALERGWLVVAPRQGLVGLSLNCEQMLNALEPFFSIDRSRVFLLGHSMGAAQVIQQVHLNPDLPRAAAAIGGGRPTREPVKIANLPWFVSAGELDFGREGAKSFHQSLVDAGATNAVYVEYPGIEHLVIVQAALPKAFEFFDRFRDRE